MEEVILEEITLWVRRVHRPEVVGDDVEDTQNENQEYTGPFSFEADCNHDTGGKSDDGYEDTPNAPLTLDDESKEKEDEKNSPSEKEAVGHEYNHKLEKATQRMERSYYFFLSVSLILGKPAKGFLLLTMESLKTIKRPPITERLRKKNVKSKMRP